MNKIFILGANNEQLGPFTSTEVRQGLTAGKFRQDQMAFAEGLSQWTPLVDVLVHVDKTSPAPAPAPATFTAPVSASSTTLPAPATFSSSPAPLTLPTAGSYSAIQSAYGTGLSTGFNYAPYPLRMAACFIDSILLGVVQFVIGILFAIVIVAVSGGQDSQNNPIALLLQLVQVVLNVVMIVVYFSVMESSSMQGTVGKSVLGLKVTDEAGNPLGFGQAIARGFGRILSQLVCCLGFLLPLANDKKQALHDLIAKTLVLVK